MKKIFVTVEEYLENGGVLKKRHQFYQEDNGVFDTAGWWSGQKSDSVKEVFVQSLGGVYHSWSKDYYVEIDCTPIYA